MVGDEGSASVASGARLSVVVVGYRQPELLSRAVEALARGTRVPDEVVVVDVSPSEIWDATGSATVVTVHDNPGYAAACMRGASEVDGDWLLFMNADVTVAPDTIERTLQVACAEDSIGIATCRLVLPDGSLDHACHRGTPSVLDSLTYKLGLDRLGLAPRRLGHYRLTWLDTSESHDVEACSGAFLLIRREAFEAVGGWDREYRFYGEDLDLCLRVTEAGWRVYYVSEASAEHAKGSASHLSQDPSRLTDDQLAARRWVQHAALEAHERFYEQHMEAGTARWLRPFVRGSFALQRRRLESSDG